ncbi:GNAT family N-acetyltransferase [Actinomadura chibensis]|uniref:GNAT family N-acetyltransferase n=1 Tax=Actinomadura chibensis TaxID=392828 RepID=A0A5D0NPX5_9ACTN|nr:GNAT family N-acetyltransferase [Actinomadura chibensis]TYB46131.1 GNAT family N-acetyltransferase [Actinomadura chibensis]
MTAETARSLQEKAARALPADDTREVGGWRLRHTRGPSWWIGTVLPHGDAEPGELARRIAEAEDFYARRGAAARFQITPGVCPDTLDAALAERGYQRELTVSLRVAATRRLLTRPPSKRVRVDDHPSREWLETWQAVNGGDVDAERDLLRRVPGPSGYASLIDGGSVVAVGRAVADDGWAGIFGMATRAEARGRGAGRDVLAALADWARARRATRMYLQVLTGNRPAVRLYEGAGFGELCGYHYRRR